MPSAGTATAGKGATVVATSTNASPTLRYLPAFSFDPTVIRGDSVVPLLNNSYYAANKVLGASFARLDMAMPFIAGVHNADFFARQFLSVTADTDAANYHTYSLYPDAVGSAALTYQLCKFGAWQLSGTYGSGSGQGMMIGQQMSAVSLDPEHGTALAAPSSGSLSTSKLLSFAQVAITGASDVVSFSVSMNMGLEIVGPAVAGLNANFPYLPKGALQTDLLGSVTITQKRNPTTAFGDAGADGTLTFAIGTTGAGVSFAFMLSPISKVFPSRMGTNYRTTSFQIKSTDGTAPVTATDM